MDRELTYSAALHEATESEMAADSSVIVMGLGVDDHLGIYGTTRGLAEKFGKERCFDTPLAEDGMTGVAIGAAMAGLRPIHVHIRMDFLILAVNQLVNFASKAHYMYGGQVSVPLVIRAIIGRSWGQGAQHSQALYSWFMHTPGLKVIAPSTPYDAKGTLIQSIRDNNPVVFVEHRHLHNHSGPVPQESYTVPFGKARQLAAGDDVTIVGVSYMALEAFRAHEYLSEVSIGADVFDPVSLAPLDIDTIAASVARTGRLVVADNGWTSCGASAEIVTQVLEKLNGVRPVSFRRVGFAPVVCPTTRKLEDRFYPTAVDVARAAHELVRPGAARWAPEPKVAVERMEFKGPF
jgi:pyruvate/2-oxoglutarate/acetoin dehydrogenase E1 component